jgi:hypothetical protein
VDIGTRDLLTASIREVLAEAGDGADLRDRLDELGWADVLADDPAAATTILFAEQGRALARTRALDDVVLGELADALAPVNGVRAVAHPHPGDLDLDAFLPGATPVPAASARGIVLGPLDGVHELVVPVRVGPGVGAIVVPVEAVVPDPVDAFDPDLRWTAIRVGDTDAAASAGELGDRWVRVVAAARRALAAEVIGTCEAMLALAVEHTSARVQYGRTIASFQAVRHRLAEAHADVVGCTGLLEAAWADGSAWGAAVAKQAAGHLQQRVSRHALQVCGALGLSSEYSLHRFVTRAVVLDSLYLPHQQLDTHLGRELLAPAAVGRPLARLAQL